MALTPVDSEAVGVFPPSPSARTNASVSSDPGTDLLEGLVNLLAGDSERPPEEQKQNDPSSFHSWILHTISLAYPQSLPLSLVVRVRSSFSFAIGSGTDCDYYDWGSFGR